MSDGPGSPEQASKTTTETKVRQTLDKPLKRRTLLRVTAAGGVAATGLATLEGDTPSRTSQPSFITHEPPVKKPETKPNRAPYNPTGEEMRVVEEIVEQPLKPRIEYKPDATTEEIKAGLLKRRLEIAQEHGLTMHDHLTFTKDLAKDLEGEPQLDYATYVKRAQEFLKNYDITLSLADSSRDFRFLEGYALDEQTLESKKVKESLVDLIREIGDQPVELIKEMGIKNIQMLGIGSEKTRGWADMLAGDTFIFDPTKTIGTGLLHEGYHLYDVNHADQYSMYDDQGFRSLNPSTEEIYNQSGKLPANFISQTEYLKSWFSAMNAISDAKQAGDEKEVTRLTKELEAKAGQVAVTTNYAFTNIAEDKAELARDIMGGSLDGKLERKSPILRRKAIFLLARLYHDKNGPAIVKFLADTRIA
jgi:hypothetical protein